MRLCAVTFKECWTDEHGRWHTTGGFPLQMAAIGSLFPEMELVVTRGEPQGGGSPLPAHARVTALDPPRGDDLRRKLSVAARLPQILPAIASAIRRADVVHTPLPGDFPLIALVVALAARRRVIARYCGSWADTPETTLAERLTRVIMRRFAGGRNVMLATGDEAVPPAPGMTWIFATALPGAELAAVHPDLDRPLGRPPVLAFVGRLAREKGCDLFLRAVAGLRPRVPSVVMIGEGEERRRLEELAARLGIAHQVRFTGQLDRARLGAELERVDLCVQPSHTESLCKAWVDAMAYGVPVVASDVGAARRVFGEGGERGWVVPPADVAALTATLGHVLDEERDWPALRRRCRAFAEAHTLEAWTALIAERCAEQWGEDVPVTGMARA